MDITTDTLCHAEAAIRDILYLYVDMIESYGGFGHNLDAGSFAPLEFIDSEVVCPEGHTFALNVDLLHAGSAIAILCSISDCLDELDTVSLEWPLIARAKEAFAEGRFRHLPVIHEAFRLAFGGNESTFRIQLLKVYQQHVLAYFSKLVEGSPAYRDSLEEQGN